MPGLSEILKIKDSKSFGCLDDTIKSAGDCLKLIITRFPEFTNHDISHSNQVIENLNLIIPNEMKNAFHFSEIYCLLCSAYLHDIGHMIKYEKIFTNHKKDYENYYSGSKFANENISDNEILTNYIRKNHHIFSEEMILNYKVKFGLLKNSAPFIGKICHGHRDKDYSDQKLYPIRSGYADHPINTPLLSIYLNLADELDISEKRAPLILWNFIRPTNPISQLEWEKNFAVRSRHLNTEDNQQIIIDCTFGNNIDNKSRYKLIGAFFLYKNKVQRILNDLHIYLHSYHQFKSIITKNIIVTIDDNLVEEWLDEINDDFININRMGRF